MLTWALMTFWTSWFNNNNNNNGFKVRFGVERRHRGLHKNTSTWTPYSNTWNILWDTNRKYKMFRIDWRINIVFSGKLWKLNRELTRERIASQTHCIGLRCSAWYTVRISVTSLNKPVFGWNYALESVNPATLPVEQRDNQVFIGTIIYDQVIVIKSVSASVNILPTAAAASVSRPEVQIKGRDP